MLRIYSNGFLENVTSEKLTPDPTDVDRKFRLTNFHKIDIFQSRIRWVAVQIFLRFQEKARGQKETFIKYRQRER